MRIVVNSDDIHVLRDLVMQYKEVTHNPIQGQRRDLWRNHNSFRFTRPPIYTRAYAWGEMPDSRCICTDPFYKRYEENLRRRLFWASLNDDSIFEPWLAVSAAVVTPSDGIWGLPVQWSDKTTERGSRVWDPPLKKENDLERMVVPFHKVDEETTERNAARLHDAVGDLIDIVIDRSPAYRTWNGDISTQLAYLRGLEQVMWDMIDRPEWLHELLAFMRDGILKTHREAEEVGHWTLANHENQAMSYARELADPSSDPAPVKRSQLWYFAASQETTGVGPAMFDEFMLQYQIPIMAEFGLTSYGCCEDLTNKIDVVRQIPNLRRIAVSPMADVRRCAEQIGTDYVFSYRPSPAEMVSMGFDDEYVKNALRKDLEACRECCVDITLKDVETVGHDPDRVRNWVKLTREVIDEIWG